MYELIIKTHFAAAHRLRGYQGKCENLHGHNWEVEVKLRSKGLDRLGIVIDFARIKKVIAGILKNLDHQYLNQLKQFRKQNPTTENIARELYQELRQKIKKGIEVAQITVWESPGCGASYYL